jgi:hypothetical protein
LFGAVSGQFFQGMIPVGHHVIPVDHKGRDGASLDDLGKGFFFFVSSISICLKRRLRCITMSAVLRKHWLIRSLDHFGGDVFRCQGVEGILSDGFQLQQVPQGIGNPDGRSVPHRPV